MGDSRGYWAELTLTQLRRLQARLMKAFRKVN
jgi:hypothetical protein